MEEEKPSKDENYEYDDFDLFMKRTDLDFQEKRPSYEVQHHEDDMDSIDSHDLLMTQYWTKKKAYQADVTRRLNKLKKDQNIEDDKTIVANKSEKHKLILPQGFLFNTADATENIKIWKEINKKEIDEILKRASNDSPLYFNDENDEDFVYDD